jgi:hypothetical protein
MKTYGLFGRLCLILLPLALCLPAVAQADGLLYGFGLPTTNLNGYPPSSYPNRSNGSPSTPTYYSIPTTDYSIDGDKFTIGSPGQQFHIDKITVWMVYGDRDIYGNLTTQYSTTPISTNHVLSLALWFGPDGGPIVKTNATYVLSRAFYADGENYQRPSDGTWRGVYQIDFATNLIINGGQQYAYFLDGMTQFNLSDGTPTYHVPGLLAAYQPTSGVTPVGGSLDNAFYWYLVGAGSISTVPAFLPQGHYADANIAIYGHRISPPTSVLPLLLD